MTVTTVTGSDGLSYSYDSDTKTLTVNGTGSITASNRFKVDTDKLDASSAEHLIIGEGIVSIGQLAFADNYGLLDVSLPYGLTNLGGYAFAAALAVTRIDLPATLTDISGYALYRMPALSTIIFRGPEPTILANAFNNTLNIRDVYSPGWADASTFGTKIPTQTYTITYHTGVQTEYRYLTYNGYKIKVDSADRDGDGNKIKAIYVRKDSLSDVATSGSYTDLLNKPTIPTAISDLTDDSDFVESSELATMDGRAIDTGANIATGWAYYNYYVSSAVLSPNQTSTFSLSGLSTDYDYLLLALCNPGTTVSKVADTNTGGTFTVTYRNIKDTSFTVLVGWLGLRRPKAGNNSMIYVVPNSNLDYAPHPLTTVDAVPTASSNNLVKSGGVYSAIATAVSSVLRWKGTVSTLSDLPTSDRVVGDCYNVSTAGTATLDNVSITVNAGDNVAWNGTQWDVLAGTMDLSIYALASSVPDELADLTADSTHRTVTDTEKSTWNGKQDALSFMDVSMSEVE